VDAPAYTRGVAITLSEPFARSCAACHGLQGEGKALYPPLSGKLTFEQFRDKVRAGGKGMPAFDAAFITDAALESDFKALAAIAGASAVLRPASSEWSWTEAQVEDSYRRGLVIWRTPDREGVACANCHSPDGIDLAFIGYPDDAILRRAGLHVSPEHAAQLVDFVHAQRRRFNIKRPCARTWRPLQPGGEVLPGTTPDEQDASFAKVLVERRLLVATGVVETVADGRRALDELGNVDLRKLPIGIVFPRWTEDAFNGKEHGTINDYLLAVGRVPRNRSAWYALEDAYVQNPTDENLFAILRKLPSETTDNGYYARHKEANQLAQGRCNRLTSELALGFLGFVDLKKKESALIVQHFMRMAALGRPGFYEGPAAPFPHYGAQLNPFFHLGGQFAEHNCTNAARMLASFPHGPSGEIPESDRRSGSAIEMSRQLNHPWQTLGMIYDQPLMMHEDAGKQNLHYWVLNGFEQRDVHLPFMYAQRIAQQVRYFELRGQKPHPGPIGHFALSPTHPLLDGRRLMFQTGQDRAVPGGDLRAQVSNALRCNIMRAFLLVQRDLFAAGEPGNYTKTSQNNHQNLMKHYDAWESWSRTMGARDSQLHGPLAQRRELCTSGLANLIGEVRGLAMRAPEKLVD
jgi:mono/diheme cytochrome c family protein